MDTNVISEMRKVRQGRADSNVSAWLAGTVPELLYTCPVVTMELERGILDMERKDPQQGQALRAWYAALMTHVFHERIVAIDAQTAAICAGLHIPDKAPENDAWIAAVALQHGLTLVTRNTADFERTGVRLLNPFQAA
ncbi:putative nucleic acid-binding protein [Neisseria sp. HSC-16F19]|nr:type II toxin-antitoxin system VapC family toxin [Neisseria sp. HSC-16F19]MCP2040871.1 putative nucleic acid-binding protein [Neisseria sp. HSC-16F19]